MKQILQDLKSGDTVVADIPCPKVRAGHVLIQTHCSLVSVGTERMLVEFGKANMLQKAKQKPDKVKQVLAKVKTDGLMTTIEAVKAKLDELMPLGYCNVGTVIEIGAGVTEFMVGDRVVSNGPHAEVVCVPKNLCAKVPDNVTNEAAAFTVLGSIALQGVRLAQPTFGETFAVFGLGSVGLLSVQLLRAHGCQVIAIDFSAERLELAKSYGAQIVNLQNAEDPVAFVQEYSAGIGIDAVLVAAATSSDELMHQAATMCRQRGRITLVGVTGLNLRREDFYEKELSFQVSCSYGPGRYDPNYEENGQDYPIGFVRWTEQRNFVAVLQAIADEKIATQELLSVQVPIEKADEAYDLLSDKSKLGILLTYPLRDTVAVQQREIIINQPLETEQVNQVNIGLIGSGQYARRTLLPAFAKTGAQLVSVASNGGLSAMQAAKKFGFSKAVTDIDAILNDKSINTVVIATRHNTHADLVLKALEAGKHVFVEKPLCLHLDELEAIKAQLKKSSGQVLTVGFNRRFAPHIEKMYSLLQTASAPKAFTMTVNAGAIPKDHWAQDLEVGGGRIIGEVCHFVDLLRFLADADIVDADIIAADNKVLSVPDVITILLKFADGSIGTVHYFANGNNQVPKERLEVFYAGKSLQFDNFRMLRAYGCSGFKKMKSWQQDKGQQSLVASFVNAISQGGNWPVPADQLFAISELIIQLSNRVSGIDE